MQQNYQDAMTILRKHGKPDIFLTFTANPNWQDILDNLLPNQKPQDRPDIVTRVFHLKFKQLLCDILDLNFFAKVITDVYTMEFQKRGLPHTHMIISFANKDKPRTPEHVDRIISAEIPDENTHVHEHHKKHMMHGRCGFLNPACKMGIVKGSFRKTSHNKQNSMSMDTHCTEDEANQLLNSSNTD
eukprot:gene21047-biopygen14616